MPPVLQPTRVHMSSLLSPFKYDERQHDWFDTFPPPFLAKTQEQEKDGDWSRTGYLRTASLLPIWERACIRLALADTHEQGQRKPVTPHPGHPKHPPRDSLCT